MWEFSVIMGAEKGAVAKYIHKNLKRAAEEIHGVITSFEELGSIHIVFACEEYDKGRIQFLLGHLISYVICKYFKEEYLNEKLALPLANDIKLTAFKNALLSFDKETDSFIVTKNLSFEKSIYLESFYEFKLSSLKNKWSELVALANDNRAYLINHESFFELLRFLIDNLEVREGEINVMEDEEGYRILNDEFEELEELYESGPTEEQLIACLIELCPRKINMYTSGGEAIDLLSKIFDKRISFKG